MILVVKKLKHWIDFLTDINDSLKLAQQAGIDKKNMIIDGGVGFRKSYEQNLEVINKTQRLAQFGCPIMIATSRKSVIGLTIDKPVDDRMYGTLATTAIGIMKGASFFRVHDIEANIDVIKKNPIWITIATTPFNKKNENNIILLI